MTSLHCEKPLRRYTATRNKPYRFVDSGLSKVYLVGVKYWVCQVCGAQAAEIPAPEQLMNAIAEAIVMSPGILCGEEIRFLRKRVGKKAADFAELINNTPEHFSKLETGALPVKEATDKLIRLTYGMLSGNKYLLLKLSAGIEQWFKSIHGKKIQSIKLKSRNNNWIELKPAV
ncbi:MAG TPA: type II TA system antitoxin MqsA family protein [Candidatus Angelobacter sp.]|jgi:putative zinc finger/helix-turn-helix YgiT family protein|nr:type II TA system antitoxin MqsA family protein [Candidatus Angelobacter sp.]